MLKAILIAAVAAMACWGSAAATPDTAKKTLSCVAAAEAKLASPGPCVGIITAACVAGKDEGAQETCAAQELAFWQAQLDKSWKQAGPLLKGAHLLDDQAAAQKLWLQYRDKSCTIADKVDPGMMPGGSARCRMEETAARTFAVRAIVDALSEH